MLNFTNNSPEKFNFMVLIFLEGFNLDDETPFELL